MAVFQVRALDVNGDPLRGAGLYNFLVDLEACAQVISTRLKLLLGEWFLALNDGLPLFQSLLSHPITSNAVALIISQRILGSPYVTGVSNIQVTYSSVRQFAFYADVQTSFGPLAVSSNNGVIVINT